MHLQGTITATHAQRPDAIANGLNFLVSCRLNIKFDQHVLVVAYAGGFNLVEYFSNQLRCAVGCPNGQNSLTLTAAAADRLQAYTVLRIIGGHFTNRLGQCFAQLINGVEVYAFAVRGGQYNIGFILQADLWVIELLIGDIKGMFINDCLERSNVSMLFEQGQCRAVVDPRRDRHA